MLFTGKSRAESFSKDYQIVLRDLIRGLTSVIISNSKIQSVLSKSVALFLTDLFSLMDRGFILQLAGSVVNRIDPRNAIQTLVSSKFKILKIFCSYEHFIQINIPITTPLQSIITVMKDFWYVQTLKY